jgi:hypothetical protein
MLAFRRFLPALVGLAPLFLLSLAPSAAAEEPASGPATVTVRAEGLTQTLLPPTEVTTTTTPVIKDGKDECSGTSAAGALQIATSGNWDGEWFSGLGYSVETIEGESYPFTQPYYWSFWFDNRPATVGICLTQVHSGDSILFFPECFSETAGVCPASPPNPLGIDAPADVEVNRPVMVTVTSYANATGAASPAVGADVSGEGVSATTNSDGQATVSFSSSGQFILHATAPGSVRTEADICVHNGDDGTCGTTAPSGTPPPSSSSTPAGGVLSQRSQAVPVAFVADLIGIGEGRHYSDGDAPRVLSGKVVTASPVTSISLRLRRTYHGRCWAYSGTRERLQRVRCREGGFFRIASGGETFSYLLPSRLPPGRYVLDVEATDASGNRTTLARNTSRLVFYVG